MQEILIPDILDGSSQTKNETLYSLKLVCDYVKYIVPTSPLSMRVISPSEEMGIPFESLMELLSYDESLKVFLRSYYEYKNNPHKNYVVAKTLTQAFSETKLDIKGKYLPKDFTGFFEIRGLKDNDGDDIKGIFVKIDKKAVTVGIMTYSELTKSYSVGHFNSDRPQDDESIADKIKSYPYTEIGTNLKNKTKSDVIDLIKSGEIPEVSSLTPKYHNHLHVLFNCVLYVTHCAELKEEINTFSTKRSKKEWELKQYTKSPYIFVGRNFQMPKSYTNEEILVRGHWRWQHHGPECSLLKHIYIDPYLKSYHG